MKNLRAGGGMREKGGHVLKNTTSRGLCGRVWPPHTIERRGGGGVVSKKVGEEKRGARGGVPTVDRRGDNATCVDVEIGPQRRCLGRSQTDLTPASQLARTQTLNPKPSCAQTLRAQTLKPNRYTGGSSGAGHRRLNLCGRVLVDSDTRKQVKMRCCTPATPILSLTSPSTS